MSKNFYKHLLSLIISFSVLCCFLNTNQALAQNATARQANPKLGSQITSILGNVAGPAGFDADDTTGEKLPYIIGGLIRVVLSMLGVVFISFIVYAGFLWLTAGGNKEQVSKAIDIIKNASIGLAVVVIAYAISSFIVNAIINASWSGGSSGGGIK